MRSALGIVIGLAARAEVTLFDEPYAGLDPVARQLFYDRLLADYAEHPRTVLLSTHLIDEAAGLLERVVVIDRGQIVLDAAADDVRGAATSVSGPAIAVAEFTAGRTVWNRRRIAGQESAVVAGPLDDSDHARARALRLTPGAADAAAGRGPRRPASPKTPRAGKDERMNTWIKVARFHLVDRLELHGTALGRPGLQLRDLAASSPASSAVAVVQVPSVRTSARSTWSSSSWAC